MGSRKINELGASTFLFSVICDRARPSSPSRPVPDAPWLSPREAGRIPRRVPPRNPLLKRRCIRLVGDIPSTAQIPIASRDLSTKLIHYPLAIAEPIMCQEARLLDADPFPWTPTVTFYKLLEIERSSLPDTFVSHSDRDI